MTTGIFPEDLPTALHPATLQHEKALLLLGLGDLKRLLRDVKLVSGLPY